jgi:Family of unknown function (DUF6492)
MNSSSKTGLRGRSAVQLGMKVLADERGKLIRRLRSHFHRYAWSWLPRSYGESDRHVVVVMPLAEKDLDVAKFCIAGIRRFLRHPVDRIVAPSQSSRVIEQFCRRHDVEYIEEQTVLSPNVLNFNYRNGWIRQQLLKLTACSYLDGDNFLVIDSDTVLARELSFFEGSKQILWTADDLVDDYHPFTQEMIGVVRRHPYSFVTHCMLFQRPLLLELQRVIEERFKVNWVDAILSSIRTGTTAGMSEYELYAHFLLKYHPEAFVTKYWYNKKVSLRGGIDAARARALGRRFNFLSDHVQSPS